jgi:hypothetical protein
MEEKGKRTKKCTYVRMEEKYVRMDEKENTDDDLTRTCGSKRSG